MTRKSVTHNRCINSIFYEDGNVKLVRSRVSSSSAIKLRAEHMTPRISCRSEARNVPAGSASNDAHTSLPKWQTDREVGTQSNGSLRDSRATEEAPSADEPSWTTSFGGIAV